MAARLFPKAVGVNLRRQVAHALYRGSNTVAPEWVLLGTACPWRADPVAHAIVRTADFVAAALTQGDLGMLDLQHAWDATPGPYPGTRPCRRRFQLRRPFQIKV